MKLKALKMSSARNEKLCQSSRGAPSNAQMIGDGVRSRDVGDDVTAARAGDLIDQLVHHVDHGVV